METCNWFLWEMGQTVMNCFPFYTDFSALKKQSDVPPKCRKFRIVDIVVLTEKN